MARTTSTGRVLGKHCWWKRTGSHRRRGPAGVGGGGVRLGPRVAVDVALAGFGGVADGSGDGVRRLLQGRVPMGLVPLLVHEPELVEVDEGHAERRTAPRGRRGDRREILVETAAIADARERVGARQRRELGLLALQPHEPLVHGRARRVEIRAVDDQAVTAGRLRRVCGGVGGLERAVGGAGARAGLGGRPDLRQPRRGGDHADGVRPPQFPQHAPDDRLGLAVRGARHQHRELLAADAGDGRAGVAGQDGGDPPRDLGQDGVARQMAVHVVDPLEVVEVEDGDEAGPPREGQLTEAVLEQEAVRDPGQGVGGGLVAELGRARVVAGHVVQDERDDAPALGVVVGRALDLQDAPRLPTQRGLSGGGRPRGRRRERLQHRADTPAVEDVEGAADGRPAQDAPGFRARGDHPSAQVADDHGHAGGAGERHPVGLRRGTAESPRHAVVLCSRLPNGIGIRPDVPERIRFTPGPAAADPDGEPPC